MRVGIYARVSTDTQQARATIGSQLQTLRARVAAEGDELVEEFVETATPGRGWTAPDWTGCATPPKRAPSTPSGACRRIGWPAPTPTRSSSWTSSPLGCRSVSPTPHRWSRPARAAAGPDPRRDRRTRTGKFAERGRRGKLYRARAGEVLSPKVPYGYRRVPAGGRRRPTDRARTRGGRGAPDLRRLPGRRQCRGTRWPSPLRASPHRKASAVWRLATICRLLRNEAYAGRLYWNRTARPATTPPSGRTASDPGHREEWIDDPHPGPHRRGHPRGRRGQAGRDNAASAPAAPSPTPSCCAGCCAAAAAESSWTATGPSASTGRPATTCVPTTTRRAGGAGPPLHRTAHPRRRAGRLRLRPGRALLAQPDLLAAGQTTVAAQAPAPDDELLSTQLARLHRRVQAAHAERRRVADLYQAGVIEAADLARRAASSSTRRPRLDDERRPWSPSGPS